MTKTQKPATTDYAQKDTAQKEQTFGKLKSVSSVVARNQQLEEQLESLENELKRALADYRNLERHVAEERKLLTQLSSAILIEKFLPVLDNLESAQSHLNDQGLTMVIKQFKDILAQEGVEEILAQDSTFDPKLHEATAVTEGENDGRIVKVIRTGYKLNDKVLRPARVVVERRTVDQQIEEKAQDAKDLGDYA